MKTSTRTHEGRVALVTGGPARKMVKAAAFEMAEAEGPKVIGDPLPDTPRFRRGKNRKQDWSNRAPIPA